jgi:putative transposase
MSDSHWWRAARRALPVVLTAVEHAFAWATPVIWHGDQGSHGTSPQYLARLTATGMHVRMEGTGRARDSVFVERLWRTVK